jgi:AraC family transcriptional regulator
MASFPDQITAPEQFTASETHGYLQGYGVEVRASSDNRGWTSVYASLQHQAPFEGTFDAVDGHFIVLHLDRSRRRS